ncbi:MAG: hypothetical protein JXP39_08760, partial [Spirochaetales bacterium]|nr:hypothetical protein [Spirochaetales bacterium]
MCNPETNETAASTVQAPLVKTPSVETPASDVVLSPWAIETRSMNFWYGNFQAVIDLDMKIERNRV